MNANEELYNWMYSENNSLYSELIKNKVKKIGGFIEGNEKKVLDIGCGNCELKDIFNKKAEYHGIDISKEALKIAREKGVITKNIDLNNDKLPYADESFDTVICSDIIEHLLFPERLIQEAYRVLKKKGSLIAVVPNVNSWSNRILVPFGFFPWSVESTGILKLNEVLVHMTYGHLKTFNKKTINKLLEKTGFKNMEYKGAPLILNSGKKYHESYDKIPDFAFRILNNLEHFFSRFSSFATEIIVKAKK